MSSAARDSFAAARSLAATRVRSNLAHASDRIARNASRRASPSDAQGRAAIWFRTEESRLRTTRRVGSHEGLAGRPGTTAAGSLSCRTAGRLRSRRCRTYSGADDRVDPSRRGRRSTDRTGRLQARQRMLGGYGVSPTPDPQGLGAPSSPRSVAFPVTRDPDDWSRPSSSSAPLKRTFLLTHEAFPS